MSKYYIVYTKNMAYELRKRGFQIVKTGINRNHPQYDTYIFENSQKLQDAVHEITEAGKKKASSTTVEE